MKYRLTGWVQNTNENVLIRVAGIQADVALFLDSLQREAPPASMIEKVTIAAAEPETFTGFSILHSHNVSEDITEISPDIAVCSDCLGDIAREGSRLDYSFVNCTNCGPRFTIIRDLPYDREKTTMQPFIMCPDCREEYETITDRRFHAQPTACGTCGPQYELFIAGRRANATIMDIIGQVSTVIDNGGLVLMKGLGGMHVACDAFSETAVARLREVKNREGKPFAVMFRDARSAQVYVSMNKQEEQSLLSWRRPIVLLQTRNGTAGKIAGNVNAGLSLMGVMLPYLPFHHQLFQNLKASAIVLTSGNFSSEPILTGNQEALDQFTSHMDAIVLHDRDIYNRTDDSVVRVIDGKERIMRRSRGYVPAPVRTTLNTDGILAFGAELTNCFCVGKGKKAFLSQHIGDLQSLETTLFYEQTIERFLQLFRVKPSLLAVDMHPEYISTKTAGKFPGIPVVTVQHHHAHIASCMTEHGLDEQVIGVALDGTGFGDDGHIWGGEFFTCDLVDYKRISHFEYLPLPGGDRAAEEPWRMAVSYLYRVFGNEFRKLDLPLINEVDPDKIEGIIMMIDRKINCPLTSGAGRLFDAVASLLGLCHTATFQAEGPVRLESMVIPGCHESYPVETGSEIKFDNTIRGIVQDLTLNTDVKIIASKFHNTIISAIFESVNAIRNRGGISKVVLSGGVFQNKYLLEGTVARLRKNLFTVYSHAIVPTNDGGISLGQLAVASKRRENKCV